MTLIISRTHACVKISDSCASIVKTIASGVTLISSTAGDCDADESPAVVHKRLTVCAIGSRIYAALPIENSTSRAVLATPPGSLPRPCRGRRRGYRALYHIGFVAPMRSALRGGGGSFAIHSGGAAVVWRPRDGVYARGAMRCSPFARRRPGRYSPPWKSCGSPCPPSARGRLAGFLPRHHESSYQIRLITWKSGEVWRGGTSLQENPLSNSLAGFGISCQLSVLGF
jgi:hypothetical protein